TIDNLNKERKKSLEKTWKQVNTNFKFLKVSLIPHFFLVILIIKRFAKIQPLESQDMTNGLEVKVSLGGVWKQSLSELSGGQMSV
ncbi:putative nuclear condensin complex subunit, partial [Glomus cerebriforme]